MLQEVPCCMVVAAPAIAIQIPPAAMRGVPSTPATADARAAATSTALSLAGDLLRALSAQYALAATVGAAR